MAHDDGLKPGRRPVFISQRAGDAEGKIEQFRIIQIIAIKIQGKRLDGKCYLEFNQQTGTRDI